MYVLKWQRTRAVLKLIFAVALPIAIARRVSVKMPSPGELLAEERNVHGPVVSTFYNCGNKYKAVEESDNDWATANAYRPDATTWQELVHIQCRATLQKKQGKWILRIPDAARKGIRDAGGKEFSIMNRATGSQDLSVWMLDRTRVYQVAGHESKPYFKSFGILTESAYVALQSGPIGLHFERGGKQVHDSFAAEFHDVPYIQYNMGWRWMCDQNSEVYDSRPLPNRAMACQRAKDFALVWDEETSGNRSVPICWQTKLPPDIVQPFCPRTIVSGPKYCVPWYLPSAQNTNVDMNIPDKIPLNQLQVSGTHNSCHRTTKTIADSAPYILSTPFQVDMLPLGEQLDRGVRHLEFDLWWETEVEAWMVLHIAYWDPISLCNTLKECMLEVIRWSKLHSSHTPISIVLEVKGLIDTVYDYKRKKMPPRQRAGINLTLPLCKLRNPNPLKQLELEAVRLVSMMGPDRLITPRDVKWDGIRWNWPTVGESRGKIYFILDVTFPLDFNTCIDPPESHSLHGDPAYELDHKSNDLFVRFFYPDHFKPKLRYPEPTVPKVVELGGGTDPEEIRNLMAAGYMIRAHALRATNISKDYFSMGIVGQKKFKNSGSAQSGAQLMVTDFPRTLLLCCHAGGGKDGGEGKYGDPLRAKPIVEDAGCNINDCDPRIAERLRQAGMLPWKDSPDVASRVAGAMTAGLSGAGRIAANLLPKFDKGNASARPLMTSDRSR